MEKPGVLSRLIDRFKTSVEEAFRDAVTEVVPVEKAVRVEKGEGLLTTAPAWAWLQKHHAGAEAYAEPRWTGDRYIHSADGTVVDVIKTADDRHIVIDCLEYEGRDIRDRASEVRRWNAYAFVRKRHAAGEKAWELSPAYDVTDRLRLAKAWQLFADRRESSSGLVLKVYGPYEAGESTRWIEVLKEQPSSSDVHVDTTPKGKKRTYDEETAFIKANQATPAAQQAHAFQAAEWTHKNGHPRCLLCGEEESVTKQCAGMTARARMQKAEWTAAEIDDLPDSSFAYIAPGGSLDQHGKTTPRSLRHLPYKDASGAVDLPHLRNALARLDQASLSAEGKAHARRVLEAAAQAHGVGKGAVRVVKVDVQKRVMLGIVHQPDVEDLQGDVISADEIEKACYQFLKDYKAGKAGLRLNHKRDLSKADAQLVENYVAPVDFDIPQADGGREHVIKGSWLQGWELSPALWTGVEKGEYTGFSMGGMGIQEPITKEANDPALPPAPGPQQSVHLTVNVQPPGGATVKREKDGTLTVQPGVTTEPGK